MRARGAVRNPREVPSPEVSAQATFGADETSSRAGAGPRRKLTPVKLFKIYCAAESIWLLCTRPRCHFTALFAVGLPLIQNAANP
jgi:hypothetical protein